jgi:hypothetical protein
MKNDIKNSLEWIKKILEETEARLYIGLGWVLIFLSSLLIITFLYRFIKTGSGNEPFRWHDWTGFFVSIVLLIIGILSVVFWNRNKPL